jgi:hypothetical protein
VPLSICQNQLPTNLIELIPVAECVAGDLIKSDVRLHLRMERPRMEGDWNECHIMFTVDGQLVLKGCESGEAMPHAG